MPDAETLHAYAALGTDRVIVMLPAAPEREKLLLLDRLTAARKEVEGART